MSQKIYRTSLYPGRTSRQWRSKTQKIVLMYHSFLLSFIRVLQKIIVTTSIFENSERIIFVIIDVQKSFNEFYENSLSELNKYCLKVNKAKPQANGPKKTQTRTSPMIIIQI
jgi:hypothetical protein